MTASYRIIRIFAFLVCTTTLCSADESWTGWLGPQRTGWVHGVSKPIAWPAELSQQWQLEVGTGYGSPVVHDGRVYQHARVGENEVLACFELETGKEIWKQEFSVPFKMGGGGEWHGKGPKSCPLLADGCLFTMSINGVLTAWDATEGKKLWHRDYAPEFKVGHPYWGASTSPIAVGNRVLVHFGNDKRGALVALSTKSGEELWRLGDDGTSYSSPLIVEIEKTQQLVEWNHEALQGVDLEAGKMLWRYPFPHLSHNQNMPTPTFHAGRILLGGENRGIHCLQPKKTSDGWQVAEIWDQDALALDMSTAVVHGDRLFGFSHYDKGRLFCLNARNGRIIWRGPPRSGSNVTFLAMPSHVLALKDNGQVLVLDAAADDMKIVAEYRVANSPTWAPPVLLSGGLLIKSSTQLTYWSID